MHTINSVLHFVKPLTIWRMKHGTVVMVASEIMNLDNDGYFTGAPRLNQYSYVRVINAGDNRYDVQYLDSFLEATLIG